MWGAKTSINNDYLNCWLHWRLLNPAPGAVRPSPSYAPVFYVIICNDALSIRRLYIVYILIQLSDDDGSIHMFPNLYLTACVVWPRAEVKLIIKVCSLVPTSKSISPRLTEENSDKRFLGTGHSRICSTCVRHTRRANAASWVYYCKNC